MSGKAGVFLDASYLEIFFKKCFPNLATPKLDYKKLALKMTEGQSSAFRGYYTHCPRVDKRDHMPDYIRDFEKTRLKEHEKLKHVLTRLYGYIVREGFLTYDVENDRYRQKGVDVLLAMDATRLILGEKIDKICLLAGDGDFVPVVEFAEEKGVPTVLWHSGKVHPPSGELVKRCVENHSLEDIALEILVC